jgi:hypothetical protein
VDDYGHFPSPVPMGNLEQNLRNGSANIRKVAYKFGKRYNAEFSRRFERIAKPTCGIDAVYKLFAKIYKGQLVFRPEYDEIEFKTFGEKALKAFGPAGYSSPKTWEVFAKKAHEAWDEKDHKSPLFWFQQAEAVRHLTVAAGLKSYKAACRKAKQDEKPLPWLDKKVIFGDKKTSWRAYRHAAITILEYAPENKDERNKASYVLLGKDLTRLSQMLESTGKIFHYFSWYADEQNMLSRRLSLCADEIMSLLVRSFTNTTPNQKNSICRSMDIGQYIYLAEKAGPLSQRSLNSQRKKGFDGHYDQVFPLSELVNILSRWKPREALELASIRKMLPVPDFCIYSAMNNNYLKHSNPFSQIPHSDPNTTWDDFILYWEHSMIRNFHERHNKCPGAIKNDAEHKDWHNNYPRILPKFIPYKEIRDIDWHGTFVYSDYNYAEHELRKDKTTAPNRVPENMTSKELTELPLYERNQIANLFLNPNMPRLKDLREQIKNNNEGFDYVHLTALKPEAKKEGGRMFYMGNDAQRTPLSEKEANTSEYLVHKPGNSSGISSKDLLKHMREIALLSTRAIRKVMVSFDIEAWSPKQNPKLKEEAYRIWGYAYGLDHIQSLLKIFHGSRLAFIKHNIHHEYVNQGQDLEGYDAKTNTAMHIEVMGYAINACRRLGKLKHGASLLCLIDDGGMSLEFDYDATDEQILDCIGCIEEVYHMVGLRLSWDKTFVSERLFQYLNEVYYGGFKVTPGLKAFLRVGKDVDVPAKTISDDLDAFAGQIQGGLKAGASYMMSYAMYMFEVYRTLKRWSRYKVKIEDRHILMCLTPLAFGGLGIRSLVQLSTNEAFNPVTAGIGNLKAFCTYYPKNAPIVNMMINARMREMKPENFVRAPRAIRAEVRTLNLQRFANTMREWLMKESRNPYIKSVLSLSFDESTTIFCERIASQREVSAMGLQALSNLSPGAAIDKLVNKLQRSQTAASLLGFKDVLRIMLANKFQAARCIEEFGRELSMQRLAFVKTN